MTFHLDLASFVNTRRDILKSFGAAAIGITMGSGLTGCSEKPVKKIPPTGEPKTLSFHNWATYVADDTLDNFKRASDITINMTPLRTNEDLYALLKTKNTGFDVIMPSNDFVERLIKEDMLLPLDHSLIPNKANIAPNFTNVSYDPGRLYSMPYTWLVFGIGYDKSKVKVKPDSWKSIFESDQYKGRIGLLSEPSTLYKLYAKYLGLSLNTMTRADVDRITAMMIKNKPNIKIFHDDNGQDLLLGGEVDLVLEYNGDIAQAIARESDLDFVIPKEGSLLKSDCLCIPKTSARPKNAHAFINYLLEAEVAKDIYEAIKYPAPNAAATALMGDDYKKNRTIFPPSDVLARCEYASFNGELQDLFEKGYTALRAA
jgi:spermidine/putrescine transport system substrate-binding protein